MIRPGAGRGKEPVTPAATRLEVKATDELVPPPGLEIIHPHPMAGGHSASPVTVGRDPKTGSHWFLYADGCRFEIAPSGEHVAASHPPELSREDLQVYLTGPILGFVLRLRGVVSLHASAVLLDGKAVAFVGAGGAGKSTLAARFALAGVPVVTDDILPLEDSDDGFLVRSSVPHLKLWPDSVTQLYGRPDALPKLVPSSVDWDKRCLDLTQPELRWAEGAHPLGAIYLLERRHAEAAAPELTHPTPAEALVALTANAYVNYALTKAMRAQEFAVLSRLVRQVPVRRLTLPATAPNLTTLRETLERDLAGSSP